MNISRDYYVYEHIRLDDMTCFYVGKGKGERAYDRGRNKYHESIANKYGYLVTIISDNLTEDEAYWLERDIIEEYVFELGYGIAIKGFSKSEVGNLTNATFGGTGGVGVKPSDNTRKLYSSMRKGSNNPRSKKVICINTLLVFETIKEAAYFYNIKTRGHISSFCKGKLKSYGKLDGVPLVWMYLDEYYVTSKEEIETKIRKSLEIETTKESKILHSEKISGGNNPRAKAVYCITTKETFETAKQGSLFYNIGINGSSVTACCKGRLRSAGKHPFTGKKLVWMYYEDYINKVG